MSAFTEACSVSERSWSFIEPHLKANSYDGRFVRAEKGAHAYEIQIKLGDVLRNTSRLEVQCIEVKAEENFTGKLFLEWWSNRNTGRKGWMRTLESDLLWYHFLDADVLYELPFRPLSEWLEAKVQAGAPWPMLEQRKRSQRNDTWGFPVPIFTLWKEGLIAQSFRLVNPNSIDTALLYLSPGVCEKCGQDLTRYGSRMLIWAVAKDRLCTDCLNAWYPVKAHSSSAQSVRS
jgi:hypothetical protein